MTDRSPQSRFGQKSPAQRTNLEPEAGDTLRIFHTELTFAQTMRRPTVWTVGLLVAIGVVYGLIVLAQALMNDSLSLPSIQYMEVAILGAKNNEGIEDGQIWRLGTSILLHANLVHLLINGYALWVLGRILEKLYGPRRFAIVFFFSGFAGALASFAFMDQNSVGASGAIFGLLGAAVVFGFRFKAELPPRVRRALTVGLLPWVAINLAIGFSWKGIDNAAHLGGLVGGGVVALFLGSALSGRETKAARGLQLAILAGCLCYMGWSVYSGISYGAGCAASEADLVQCWELLVKR